MIKYIGDGDYFLGIPRRDLTDDEFAALSEADQAMLLGSRIYQQVADEAQQPAAPRAAKKVVTETPAEAPTGG